MLNVALGDARRILIDAARDLATETIGVHTQRVKCACGFGEIGNTLVAQESTQIQEVNAAWRFRDRHVWEVLKVYAGAGNGLNVAHRAKEAKVFKVRTVIRVLKDHR